MSNIFLSDRISIVFLLTHLIVGVQNVHLTRYFMFASVFAFRKIRVCAQINQRNKRIAQ